MADFIQNGGKNGFIYSHTQRRIILRKKSGDSFYNEPVMGSKTCQMHKNIIC